MDGTSFNIKAEQLEKLKSVFPEAFSEGKIDFEKLKLALGENLIIDDERYVMNWAGKSDAFIAIQTPTTATLKPERLNRDSSDSHDDHDKGSRKSLNRENHGSDNVFIEGENLEVLKVLLKSYYNKVKMIYIDPPYNTGNDSFIYPDKFSETKDEYLRRIGDKDETGLLLKEGLFRRNSKESGRYHSNWLSMMYPRLFLARNLLRDDGVIFVSIDDNEVHNLRLMMNEIFGEECLVGLLTILCNPKGRSQDKYFASNHEYVLVYSKTALPKGYFSVSKEGDQVEEEYPEEDEIDKYRLLELRNTHREFGKHNRRNLFYPFFVNKDGEISIEENNGSEKILPIWDDGFEGCWTWDRAKASNDIALLVARKVKDRWKIYRKSYAHGADRMLKTILIDKHFYTERGQKEFNRLFDSKSKLFQSPKSPFLISQLLQTVTSGSDVILDFFAGSGTTAQAVLELNKEDGGNRKFILVQLPEKTDEESEAYKAGYKTIAEICKERIRRVINKIRTADAADTMMKDDKKGIHEELSLRDVGRPDKSGSPTSDSANRSTVDLGFKVFKLEPSNLKIWRTDTIENEEDLKRQMEAFTDPVKAASEEENMAWEILIKSGYELTTKIETLWLGGSSAKKKADKSTPDLINRGMPIYSIADGELILALTSISEATIASIIEKKPKKVLCLDKLFAGNDQLKTNTVLQMRDAGVEFETI